jgi:hypothetical protein
MSQFWDAITAPFFAVVDFALAAPIATTIGTVGAAAITVAMLIAHG